MPAKPATVVRFNSAWRGYAPGTVSDQLGRGVAEILVQRGIAEWNRDEQRPAKRASRRRTRI